MSKQFRLNHVNRPNSNRELLALRYQLEMFVRQVHPSDSRKENTYLLESYGSGGGSMTIVGTDEPVRAAHKRINDENHDRRWLARKPSEADLKSFRELSEAFGGFEPVLVSKTVYRPGKRRVFAEYGVFNHNRWVPSEVQPSGRYLQVRPALYQSFLDRMFPDPEQQDFFDYWCAQLVVKPEEQVDVIIVLRGENGTGKGFWFETVMPRLIGNSNAKCTTLKELKGQFNGAIKVSTLIFLDEGKDRSPACYDMLKKLSTEKHSMINEKYVKQHFIETSFRLVHASNHDVPFQIDDGDRRFWVPDWQGFKAQRDDETVTLEAARSEHRLFIQRFAGWLEADDGYQSLCDYYHSLPMDPQRLRQAPPTTPERKKLVKADLDAEHADVLRKYLDGAADQLVAPSLIQKQPQFQYMSIPAIIQVMEDEGWGRLGRKRIPAGEHATGPKSKWPLASLWFHPKHNEGARAKHPDELVSMPVAGLSKF